MPADTSFKPIRIGYYKAPADQPVVPYVVPPGSELIELVVEGVVFFESEGRHLTLGCGALFWHVAGDQTIYQTERSAPYECLSILFSARSRPVRPAPRLSLIADHQRARDLSQELLRTYHDDAVDRGILGNYARSRMLWEAHLAAALNSQKDRPTSLDAGLAFIEAEFHQAGLGVRDIARASGLSVPHLHALFRKHLSQSPHQFLTARRIREAKWTLAGTNLAVKAIAADCGFLNLETFYRAFKKCVGSPPHEFRKKHALPVLAHQQ